MGPRWVSGVIDSAARAQLLRAWVRALQVHTHPSLLPTWSETTDRDGGVPDPG